MYCVMPKLEFFQRVREIIDNSEVDDATILITYCDHEIEKALAMQKDVDRRAKERTDNIKEQSERVYTVMTRKFRCIYEITKDLRMRYPQYIWTNKLVVSCINLLEKQNRVERIKNGFSYSDPETGYTLSKGIGYRRTTE